MYSVFAFWGCFWLIVLAAIYGIAHLKSKAALLVGLFALFCVCLLSMSPAWTLASLLMFAVVCACPRQHFQPGRLTLVCGVIIAVSCGFVVSASVRRLHELDEWRREFAFQSVADRLRYEERTAGPNAAAKITTPLNTEVAARLTEDEDRNSYNPRRDLLRRLHDDTRAEFEVLTGFGPIRMMRLHRRGLELPPSTPVPQPVPADAPPNFDPAWTGLETLPVPRAEPDTGLLWLHETGLHDFLDAGRMGYIVDRDHVAGFESHRFSQLPSVSRGKDPNTWEVQRLELIGLLSHDRPVAYVTEYLPDLEEMGDAAVRDLDEFEQDGLEQLRTESDVVTADFPMHIRMLGAVRASQSCLECHQVRRGELLGAFSYVIAPRDGTPPPNPEDIAAATRQDSMARR